METAATGPHFLEQSRKYINEGALDVVFLRGYIAAVDIMHGTLTVTLENGWRMSNVKPLVESAAAAQSVLNQPDVLQVPCMVMVVGKGLSRQAFLMGIFTETDPDGESQMKTNEFIQGDQGFAIPELGAHIVLRRSGQIDLKASDMCQVRLNPKTGTLQGIAPNVEIYRDSENFIKWRQVKNAAGLPLKSSLALQVVPDLQQKAKKIALDIDENGVDLNTGEFDVTVETTGTAKTKAEKVELEGEVALGGAEARNAVALATETMEAIRAVADALNDLMTGMQQALATALAGPQATVPNSGSVAIQPILAQGIAGLTAARTQLQDFGVIASAKHSITE